LELVAFGLESTLDRIGTVRVRGVPPSPDGGVIADFTGDVGDPGALATRLETIPGVVEHGLFAPELVAIMFVGRGESVQRIDYTPS
jgi:ribose 5-phosphate isomerase A